MGSVPAGFPFAAKTALSAMFCPFSPVPIPPSLHCIPVGGFGASSGQRSEISTSISTVPLEACWLAGFCAELFWAFWFCTAAFCALLLLAGGVAWGVTPFLL